jgi:hypothetical protein
MSRTAKVTTAITAVAALSGAGFLAAGNNGHHGVDSVRSSTSDKTPNTLVNDTIDRSKLDPRIFCEVGPETKTIELSSGQKLADRATDYAFSTLRAEGSFAGPDSPEVLACADVILRTTTEVANVNGVKTISVPTVLRVIEP